MRNLFCIALALTIAFSASSSPSAAQSADSADRPPKEIEKDLSSGDGNSKKSAYIVYAKDEVTGVDKEYAILRYLGLKPSSQSLVTEGKATYDVIEATDVRTSQKREVWFNISKFFGKLF